MQVNDTGNERSSSQRVLTLLAITALFTLAFIMTARNDTGSETLADTVTVRGRVTDYTGALLEGALVTFSSPGDTASATTDRNGEYMVVLNRVPTGVGYVDEKRPRVSPFTRTSPIRSTRQPPSNSNSTSPLKYASTFTTSRDSVCGV